MDAADQERHFTRWTRDHAGILHKVVNAFAEGADRDDLMQELLLAVWRAVPGFRGEAQAATFLYRVSHNAALTWRRRRRKDAALLERYRAEPAATDVPGVAPGQEGGAGPVAEKLERLYAAIRALPPLDRSLVLLSLDGLAYREMAAIHGLSESNVGARLTRARHTLTTTLKEPGHESR
jgi:RNA polymerase sigma factor (sigma-70 family)